LTAVAAVACVLLGKLLGKKKVLFRHFPMQPKRQVFEGRDHPKNAASGQWDLFVVQFTVVQDDQQVVVRDTEQREHSRDSFSLRGQQRCFRGVFDVLLQRVFVVGATTQFNEGPQPCHDIGAIT